MTRTINFTIGFIAATLDMVGALKARNAITRRNVAFLDGFDAAYSLRGM